MKHLRKFENYNLGGWIQPIKDDLLDTSIFKKIDDIRDKVKEGDVVIGVFFGGNFSAYLMKLEDNDGDLGCGDDDSWYGIEYAWGIFDPKDYNSYAEQPIELTLTANKYNV